MFCYFIPTINIVGGPIKLLWNPTFFKGKLRENLWKSKGKMMLFADKNPTFTV
jgi:hypothetical protein